MIQGRCTAYLFVCFVSLCGSFLSFLAGLLSFGWLTVWFHGWLIGGWVVGWFFGWSVDRLIN